MLIQRLVIIAACTLVAWTAQAQTILYVDQNAPGPVHDGWTWCTAFTDLQDALTPANYNVIIRVADGTYTPDRGTGVRTTAFQLKNTVKLEGGYAGCAASNPKARDIARFETILSGDLARNDVGGFDDPSRDDNCYHVVTAYEIDETAILDGFTVVSGSAEPNDVGGGLGYSSASPKVADCTFRNNFGALYGGAVGGSSGEPVFTNCTFVGNQAEAGGAVFSHLSGPTFVACRFIGNDGGAGGGAYLSFQSGGTLVDCSFIGNEAEVGGALWAIQSGSLATLSCMFTGNRATEGGGAIFLSSDALRVSGCTFSANTAPVGDTLFCAAGGSLWIDSSILADGRDLADTCPANITYSNVYGGWPGETNIFAPPNFRDVDGPDNILGNEDDDLRPTAASPGINLGKPDYWVDPNEKDLSGHARILCERVDMGAYEFGLGDTDCDLDVDLDDFVDFGACMTGPEGQSIDSGCVPFDADSDQDIDLGDAATFQREFTGT